MPGSHPEGHRPPAWQRKGKSACRRRDRDGLKAMDLGHGTPEKGFQGTKKLPVAPIGVEILFVFSLKTKRLEHKAG